MATGVVFDGDALMRALDDRRAAAGLTWPELADELYDQSHDLNVELCDHGVCSGALVRTARRGTMSCQYALVLLRWLGRPPEDFLVGPSADPGCALPEPGPGHRLRFDLAALHAELDEHRRSASLTWAALAGELGCSPSRLTNLRTARLADMDLTLQVTRRIGRPAAAFVRPTRW